MISKWKQTTIERFILGAAAGATLLASAGCSNAGEGALSGAALGAGAGAIVGSMFADAGKGALIGGAIGGVGGAVIGDQNQRNAENTRYGGRYYYGYDRCRP